jgi:hypothetical protein
MNGWAWVMVGGPVWVLAGLLVSLVIGLLVRARDLPTARHLTELRTEALAEARTVQASRDGFTENRSATFA